MNVYPVSEKMKSRLEAAGGVRLDNEVISSALEYIGEWEHDPSIQEEAGVTVTVEQAAQTVTDFLLYWWYGK